MHHYKMKTDPTFLQIPELYPESLVSRKIERMLLDVLAAPVPIEAKRKEVLELCGICLSQKLYLQGQSMESLFSFLSCYTSKDIYEARRLSLPQIEGNDSSPPYTLIPLYNPLPLMQSMYFHMRSTFAAPTTVMMELLMEVTHRNVMQLEDARRNEESRLALSGTTYKGLSHGERDIKTRQLSNRPIFQRKGYDLYNFAHRIIADSERFAVLFSRKTYVMYFDLCAHFDDMGTALWRLSHIQERLNITPSPQMLCSVQRGLLKNGNVEEALMFVGKISKVELTLPLLNSTLEIFLMSSDPRACFTVMESIRENTDSMYSVTPNEETFSLLLLACESMNEWSEAPRLLREMQVLKIRGDITCLNLMLKGLLKNGLNEYAFQLRRVMIKKKIQVWPQLDEGVSELFPKDSALNQTRRGTDYVNFKDAGNALIKGTDNTFTSSSSLDVSSSTVDLTDSFYDILPVEERKLITCDNGADIDNIEDSVTETVHPSDLDNRSKRYHDRDTTSHATIGVWDIDETGSIDRLDDVSIIDKKISMNIFNTVSPDELKEMTTPKDYFNAANDATASVESEVKPLTRQRRCKLSGKGSNGLRAISAARPTHPAYVTPMSYSQLQSLLRAGKGATIDRDYLISFLNKKGVNMSQEQRSNKAALVRKAHKVVFGMSGVSYRNRVDL
eukprot:Tbor_TRINITY_DN4360_c0_g1::TRINITY_DN4360_c0_g1_i1::g.7841::m.7841